MRYHSKVSAAVAAILGAPVTVWGAEAPADATASASTGIAEVTVTATRREETLQNVPITTRRSPARPSSS